MLVNDITVEILKKNNKNLHLYVLPPDGKVRVSAPYAMKDETIQSFVLTKMGWVKNQIQKFKNQLRQTERQYVTGESHYLWGRRYRLKLLPTTGASFVSIVSGDMRLYARKGATAQQKDAVITEWYRERIKAKIPALMDEWQQRIGVIAPHWQVKNMRTRWGTCNAVKKRIWINLQLAKKPVECLEYVIVHELCHLLEKNHGHTFVALMDRHLPGWQATRKLLNEHIMDAFETEQDRQ
jgi:predicted metal-dependent hydrolase